MKLRLAAVQLAPKLGDVPGNSHRAEELLRTLKPVDVPSLVVLPELALTGYNFESPESIKPFKEVSGQGSTAKWALTMAKELNSYVCIGYPEKVSETTYNSALLVSPSGKVVANYRKTHMYNVDQVWGCSPGLGFECFEVDFGYSRPIRVQIGICMDIDPKEFKGTQREFADAVATNCPDLVIIIMAWPIDDEPTLSYWLERVGADCPVAYVNLVGFDSDNSDTAFCGESTIATKGGTWSLSTTDEGVLDLLVDVDI